MASRLRVILKNSFSLTDSAGVDEQLEVLYRLIDLKDKDKISAKQFREFWALFGMQWGNDPKIFSSQKRVKRQEFLENLQQQEKVMIAFAFENLIQRLQQGKLFHQISSNEPASESSQDSSFDTSAASGVDKKIEIFVSESGSDDELGRKLSYGGKCTESVSDFDEHTALSSKRSPESIRFQEDTDSKRTSSNPTQSAATDSGGTLTGHTQGVRVSLDSGPDRSRGRELNSLTFSHKDRRSLEGRSNRYDRISSESETVILETPKRRGLIYKRKNIGRL